MQKKQFLLLIFIIPLFFIFFSCSKTQIHLHDRHVLSYDSVKSYAQKKGPVSLVLLDYHHDIHPGQRNLTSVNWVGNLIEEGLVSKVYWLSGRTLLLPNRNSRFAWLERSLKDTTPDTAQKIRETVELVDWHDLQKISLKKNFVITLDFDVFTKDTDNDPQNFVLELCEWIQKQKPALLTLAFSSSYQKNPSEGWSYLSSFIENWQTGSGCFFECGKFGEKAESNDDLKAWKIWKENPEVFSEYENAFLPGAYLWTSCPSSVKNALLNKKITANNKEAESVLSDWNDENLSLLKSTFPKEKLISLSKTASIAQNDFWNGKQSVHSVQNSAENAFGVAVRFKTISEDRGCLSLYKGISESEIEQAVSFCAQKACIDPRYSSIQKSEQEELFTNISIFGKWQELSFPEDFIPGSDSLILEEADGEKTLLQAAIALERNYTQEEFLSRLSNKASLGFDGWQKDGLKFYKAKTLSFTNKTLRG
ncbi:AMMECR1 domain-containing protein [Treponema sp.]|uniref:AMMECR1 domain-containing protein n=1 Tax=Treponema sp. TaxID=166 RepID=UPI003890813D